MEFTLGLAQCRHAADDDAAALVERFVRKAAERGVGLLVFPESLMSRYELERRAFVNAAQDLDGPFARTVEGLAAAYGLWVVYTANERDPHGGNPYNTAVIADDAGRRRGVYRKVHLFDAQGYRESERMSAGDRLFEPLDTPFGKLGLGICYDLRFPEAARAAALAGCELMLYPAAWVAGPSKVAQWRTLLAARAVENGMFTAGVCRCDSAYIGHSCVFGPDGSCLADAGADETLSCCTVDTAQAAAARQATPSLAHRRPDLYV